MKRSPPCPPGFTLIELLVIIAMVGLLAATALPGAAGTRAGIARIGCLNNLRQLDMGSQMYAQDDSYGRLTGSFASGLMLQADDDLSWLYPAYVKSLAPFVCPSTHNTVRDNVYNAVNPPGTLVLIERLADLIHPAVNNNGNGHSYEVQSCWFDSPAFTRRTTRTILSYRNAIRPDPGGPSGIFVFLDRMDTHPAQGWPWENWPNPYNNHGQDGGNVAFADGHAAWVGVEQWKQAISASQDYPLSWSFPPGY